MNKRFTRSPLIIVLSLACVSYFALWACAPSSTIRPNVPMRGNTNMGVGVGGSTATVIQAPTESSSTSLCGDSSESVCASGHVWMYMRLSDRIGLGLTAFGGTSSLVGGGAFLRISLATSSQFALSLDLSGGMIWAAVGLPISWRVGERVWLYTNPSYGSRVHNAARLPFGVALDIDGGPRLHLELGGGMGGLDTGAAGESGGTTAYLGAGMEWQF